MLHGDDQANASSAFDRKAAAREIIRAAEETKAYGDTSEKHTDDLSRLAHMADVFLRVQKRVMTRSKNTALGFMRVARNKKGVHRTTHSPISST